MKRSEAKEIFIKMFHDYELESHVNVDMLADEVFNHSEAIGMLPPLRSDKEFLDDTIPCQVIPEMYKWEEE